MFRALIPFSPEEQGVLRGVLAWYQQQGSQLPQLGDEEEQEEGRIDRREALETVLRRLSEEQQDAREPGERLIDFSVDELAAMAQPIRLRREWLHGSALVSGEREAEGEVVSRIAYKMRAALVELMHLLMREHDRLN